MKKIAELPNKNKTVMILELQLWCDDVRFEVPETMILYEFYFYLCTILTLGYKIFFKKRPKSKRIRKLIFSETLIIYKLLMVTFKIPRLWGSKHSDFSIWFIICIYSINLF